MIKVNASSRFSVTSVKDGKESTFNLPNGTTWQDAQNTAHSMLKTADAVAYNRKVGENHVMLGRFGRIQPEDKSGE